MKKKYLCLFAFALVWLALRVFWLDGDSGIPSFWEYGYHVTDEGYYLSGGKELYLWHSVVDLARGECQTFGYAAGMHWLSYLGHKLFGLSTWTWRIPFFILSFAGALVSFGHVARRSGNRFALLTCLSVAVLPLVVVYERTASNDTLMTALLLIAYALAFGKGGWRIPASALFISSLFLVKPAVWAMLPIVLSGILSEKKTRSSWLDAGLFIGLAVGLAFGWKTLVGLSVSEEAAKLGMGSWKLLERMSAHYPLPNFFDFANDFKAFAAYPRDPSYQLLGPIALFITALPVAFLFRQIMRRKWNAHMLLYLAVPAYIGAISVMNTIYTHYFLPMIGLLPIMLSAMREDLSEEAAAEGRMKSIVVDMVLMLTICGVATIFMATSAESPRNLVQFYSRIYNLPQANPWALTGGSIAAGTVIGLVWLAIRRGWSGIRQDGVPVGLGLFIATSVACAVYPAVHLAPQFKVETSHYLVPMVLNLIAGGTLLGVLFIHPAFVRKGWALGCLLPAFVLLTFVATPTWRTAAVELVKPATHVHAQVAEELRKLIPEGAVVIGERANQVCMSLPIKTAATILSNSDPTPVIKALWDRDPALKLYAFADSQHAYNLQHYQEHQNEFQLQLVKTFKMPSFATGKPADVHLCRIIDRRPRTK